MKTLSPKKPRALSTRISTWYRKHQRDLPWRRTRDPYAIWISEIMLQQTQVRTVIPFYERFLAAFPTVETLAGASGQEVLKVWENLGYYSRARHLHLAAKEIVTHWGGKIPKTRDDLLSLPGVGPYTAAAILSIAFGQRAAAVDGNVRRILARIFAVQEPIDQNRTLELISDLAEALVPEKGASSSYNQGIMDLGATICTPTRPACDLCPLTDLCLAFERGLQESLPVRKKRPPIPHREMTAGLIPDRQGRILIVQRAPRGLLGGLWKFPGGERMPDETLEAALQRHAREELGIRIRVDEAVASVKHAYTHFRITLHAFRCDRRSGDPRALGCAEWQWASLSSLKGFPFSKAERKVIKDIS